METQTVVLHSDRDNHKSLNNETGAGNTESDRVLIGWLLSRNAVGTTAGLSFPARTLRRGSRMASEALVELFLGSPISLLARRASSTDLEYSIAQYRREAQSPPLPIQVSKREA